MRHKTRFPWPRYQPESLKANSFEVRKFPSIATLRHRLFQLLFQRLMPSTSAPLLLRAASPAASSPTFPTPSRRGLCGGCVGTGQGQSEDHCPRRRRRRSRPRLAALGRGAFPPRHQAAKPQWRSISWCGRRKSHRRAPAGRQPTSLRWS